MHICLTLKCFMMQKSLGKVLMCLIYVRHAWKHESIFFSSTHRLYTSTLLSPKPSGLFLRLLVLLILLRLFRWRVEGPESCRWRLALLPTTTLSSSQKLLSPQRTILSALSYNIEALAIWLSIIVETTMYAGSDGIRDQLYAILFTSHSALILSSKKCNF